MKTLIIAMVAALMGALFALSFNATARGGTPSGWRLVYAHDDAGNATEGAKQALVDAVLGGKPVRVYWAGTQVQHVVNGGMLTVLQGEVFAQMPMITAQKPSVDPATVELRDGNWQTIFATNGDRALKWFVQD
ncbi:hypothetical protein [Kordiimonas aestuarii]|uniref:hypothetical protein n=1 Tax=Kordiimonas aestuarii TaxID=1005925 RepID=UPI0021CE5150|nr:hypothetical protein [Kordiimonas aestuarii]